MLPLSSVLPPFCSILLEAWIVLGPSEALLAALIAVWFPTILLRDKLNMSYVE